MTTSEGSEKALLRVPEALPVTFPRNFLRGVVVELRFPTILGLEDSPPVEIQHALRKEFPFYEQAQNVVMQANGLGHEAVYSFQSKNRRWSIGLKAYSMALSTTHYTTFEDLKERFQTVIALTLPLLDTDFFTRVGLRYQNALPVGQPDVNGWVNRSLIAPLETGVLGELEHFLQDIRGSTEVGGYLLRHGLARDAGKQAYVLDIDCYAENVEAEKVSDLLEYMHRRSFSIFRWAIGPKALEQLGPPRDKSNGHK